MITFPGRSNEFGSAVEAAEYLHSLPDYDFQSIEKTNGGWRNGMKLARFFERSNFYMEGRVKLLQDHREEWVQELARGTKIHSGIIEIADDPDQYAELSMLCRDYKVNQRPTEIIRKFSQRAVAQLGGGVATYEVAHEALTFGGESVLAGITAAIAGHISHRRHVRGKATAAFNTLHNDFNGYPHSRWHPVLPSYSYGYKVEVIAEDDASESKQIYMREDVVDLAESIIKHQQCSDDFSRDSVHPVLAGMAQISRQIDANLSEVSKLRESQSFFGESNATEQLRINQEHMQELHGELLTQYAPHLRTLESLKSQLDQQQADAELAALLEKNRRAFDELCSLHEQFTDHSQHETVHRLSNFAFKLIVENYRLGHIAEDSVDPLVKQTSEALKRIAYHIVSPEQFDDGCDKLVALVKPLRAIEAGK